jgi:hypothetical protein
MGLLLCATAVHAQDAAAAEEPPAPVIEGEALRAAMKGFRGFLVGEVVEKKQTGIMLHVRAITLIKGCTARNPSAVVGKDAPVQYAVEKDEEGQERPIPSLVRAIEHIDKLPVVAFGGPGHNATVTVGAGGKGQAVRAMTQRITMRVGEQKIQFGGNEDDEGEAEEDEEPRGPVATARVQADEDGNLVMDRVMPGAHGAATWNGMPRFQVAEEPEPEKPKPPKKAKGETDF